MRRELINIIADVHPYQIIKIKLINENKDVSDEMINNYLTFNLSAVENIESNPPLFIVKIAK